MAKDCGPMCAKMILFAFNFLFWLSGLGLVAIGVIALVDKGFQDLEVLLPTELRLLKWIAACLIGLGILILMIGFCGCCGAIRESKCLLGLYIFFLIIIMAAEIAVGAYVVIMKGTIETKFTSEATKMLDHYPPANDTKNTKNVVFGASVDELQRRANCCGVSNKTDWKKTTWYKQSDEKARIIGVPPSCCPGGKYDDCKGNAFKNGCKDRTMQLARANLPIIFGVGFGVAFLEILGLVLSICLCRAIGQEDAGTYY